MEFKKRYGDLNTAQKAAVDAIDGPLLVVAGPGTGKTELLSMRVANILQKTDTSPENILLLTFTESGAAAMRERLTGIIGPDAYKVAIHTFHSFGTEVINQSREYFYNGAEYKPADEVMTYELLEGIFDTLDYKNPLAVKNQGSYVYLPDVTRAISELKMAGLSSDELLKILDANELVLDTVEKDLSRIFEQKIAIGMLDDLAPVAATIASLPQPQLPTGITPLANVLALSLAHAVDSAAQLNKTTPITAWRNEWLEYDSDKKYVFKDRRRTEKLRAAAYIYFAYLARMNELGLYDYDDMVLNVIHTMELRPDLRANLQEKYQYVLVDEFQDTNLAQLRLLFDLMPHEADNIMAVGDDDQAIYSFQGADVNNIHKFRTAYPTAPILVLTENYRSTKGILHHSRSIITQGDDRLEDTIAELEKKLSATITADGAISLHEAPSIASERAWLANHVTNSIKQGTKPEDIAIIARRHAELVALVPYLQANGIQVNYERRDNVLENELIKQIIAVSQLIIALYEQRLADANALLPQIVSYPASGFSPQAIWSLSLEAYKQEKLWLEAMAEKPEFSPFIAWAQELAQQSGTLPLAQILDIITGLPDAPVLADYTAPLFSYYFGSKEQLGTYLSHLEALRTIRTHLRGFMPNQALFLTDFLHYIDMHTASGTGITSIRSFTNNQSGAVNLLTAHKSKGLEFQNVYIIGAVDSAWGEKVRVKSRLISYPRNLAIAPAGDTYSERVRLFYVAMTRAKHNLYISYSTQDDNGKPLLPASFLTGTSLVAAVEPPLAEDQAVIASTLDWRGALTNAPSTAMETLLQPVLQSFKLSVTALHNFTDITKGGPQYFLLNNLLHVPSAKSPSAQYGTAIHETLQRVHNEYIATGTRRPIEDILHQFEAILAAEHLATTDHEFYVKRGLNSLTRFLGEYYESFTKTQKTELSFARQGVIIGNAALTGKLDLVDIHNGAITVTDYKTGTPAASWKGTTDYEKIKLYKYRQQLMFYELLIQHSRDYAKYDFSGGVLQFVEPSTTGAICQLDAQFTPEELADFSRLVNAVWQSIMALDLPDTSAYSSNLKGIQAFEHDLIDKYS